MEITLNQPDKRYCWNCISLSYRHTSLSGNMSDETADFKHEFRCEVFKVPLESVAAKCSCLVTAKKCKQCIEMQKEIEKLKAVKPCGEQINR